MTITTHHGSKVRTASQRRFVAISERVSKDDGSVSAVWIDKRSDSLDTLQAHVNRKNRADVWDSREVIIRTIFDQRTGAEVAT